MSASELGLVALQLVVVVATGWTVGSLALSALFDEGDVDLPERALAAIAGFAVLSIALTIVHLLTGGSVFGNPIVVPCVALGLLVVAFRRQVWRVSIPWKVVVPLMIVLLALYVVPMFIVGSSVREGDPPWHMGWTHELLDGQPLPDGPAPEFARNAYPWGWHGILATMTRLVPGASPLLSHETLHILLVFALPLAATCLARRVRPAAGLFAAAAAALIGGFGWISARDVDFVASPTEARYGADMVVASPNSVYELLPPALPREMGVVLLAIAGTLMLLALRGQRSARWYASGVLAGCASLVSFPMLIPALLWATVAAFVSERGDRFRSWLRIVLPTVLLFALWFGPLIYWYLTEGGFVDVVPVLGVEWPLMQALAAWGLLLPFALVGIYVAARDRTPEARAMIGFALVSAISIFLAIARREFDWSLQGNETLLHQGRMWPVAHLVGAALAGIALTRLYRRARGRSQHLATALLGGVVVIGSASLILSSLGLAGLIADDDKGFVYADEDVAHGSFVRRAAAHLSPGDVVLVDGSNALAFKLFEFSGVSLAEYDDPRLEGNEVRIRYKNLAASYVERLETTGFDPSHVVVPAGSTPEGELLAEGEYQGRDWILVRLRSPTASG